MTIAGRFSSLRFTVKSFSSTPLLPEFVVFLRSPKILLWFWTKDLNMHHSSEDVQDNQIDSTNTPIKDSTVMTIKYLRARLLSERSVSKVTREKANELANQVAELEEQLKIVRIQRKKAEKATLDLLAILENHGIGEISDEYDSDYGLEESLHDPNVDNSNSVKEEVSSPTSKRKEGPSGSEHESIPSTGRSVSWKSNKNSPRSCERKYIDSSVQRRSNFVQSAASSRHRLGKTCRQIKRREIRSIAEEPTHKSTSIDAHGSGNVDDSLHIINGWDTNPEELRKFCENNVEKALINVQITVSSEAEGQVSGSSISVTSVHKHTCDGEMERVLQQQAHLIGRFEAEEKAQREWEENYTRNGYNIPESCEPGNQSDVTEERDAPEERDETKALAPSPSEIVTSNSSCHKSEEETVCFGKGSSFTHIDSFKFSPTTAAESLDNFKGNELQCCKASASDFAFPVVNETQVLTDNYPSNSPAQSSLSQSKCHSSYSHNFSPIDSGDNHIREETPPSTRSREYAMVPHEGPQRVGGVLEALQQAKQLFEQHISCMLSEEMRFSTATAETSVCAMRDANRVKMAVGSSSLFRVPSDFQFEVSGPQTASLGSVYQPHLNDYCYYSSAPLTGDNQRLLHSMELRTSSSIFDPFCSSMPTSTQFRNSSSKPWYGTSLPLSSGFTPYSSNSTYPDVTRRLSSGEPYTVQSPSRTSEVPALGHPTFYNDLYRY